MGRAQPPWPQGLTHTHPLLPLHGALSKPGGASLLLHLRESIHLSQTVSSTRNVKLSIGCCFLWLNFHCVLLIYWYLLIKNVGQHTPGCIVVKRYIEIHILVSLSPHPPTLACAHVCLGTGGPTLTVSLWLAALEWRSLPVNTSAYTTCRCFICKWPTQCSIESCTYKHYLFYETLFLCFNSRATQP